MAISRELPAEVKQRSIAILRESLNFARSNPERLLPFILRYAQEKEPAIVWQHISTYVNEETMNLSLRGVEAIKVLIDCPLPKDWLYL